MKKSSSLLPVNSSAISGLSWNDSSYNNCGQRSIACLHHENILGIREKEVSSYRGTKYVFQSFIGLYFNNIWSKQTKKQRKIVLNQDFITFQSTGLALYYKVLFLNKEICFRMPSYLPRSILNTWRSKIQHKLLGDFVGKMTLASGHNSKRYNNVPWKTTYFQNHQNSLKTIYYFSFIFLCLF